VHVGYMCVIYMYIHALVRVRDTALLLLLPPPPPLLPQDLRVLSLAFYRPFIYEVNPKPKTQTPNPKL